MRTSRQIASAIRSWMPAAVSLLTALLIGGCNINIDTESVENSLPDPDDLGNLGDIEICGDQTLEELMTADEISDSCRDALESWLPDPQNSAEGKLLVLGERVDEDGSRLLYLQGVDTEGAALTAEALAEATVSIDIGGEATVLAAADISITVVVDIASDIFSIAVVNDYSASMRDGDLDDMELIHTDLFSYFPPLYEAEVTYFSETVDVKLPFSEDADAVLAAVARDNSYDRTSTALLDGMGTALDSLVTRERPVKVMIVGTDGAENASTQYTQSQLLNTIEQQGVFVIMLGALMADVDALRTLAGDRGVYFYARGYGRLRNAVQPFLESFAEMVQIGIPPEYADADSIIVEAGGLSLTVQ